MDSSSRGRSLRRTRSDGRVPAGAGPGHGVPELVGRVLVAGWYRLQSREEHVLEPTPAKPQGPSGYYVAYITIASVLAVAGFLGILTIGILILPIAVAMFIGLAFWHRPWIPATIVTTVAAFSLGYMGSAPLNCFASSVKRSGVPVVHEEGCSRLFLPDLDRAAQSSDGQLALAIATATAAVLGTTVAVVGRRLEHRSRGTRQA